MKNKAFIFSGLAFLLVIPVVILAASLTSMLATGSTGVTTHLRGDEVFVVFENTERDLQRAAAISGKRAALAAVDYQDIFGEYLDLNYTSGTYGSGTCGAVREMVLTGMLDDANNDYDPSSLMNSNTLPDWVANITATVQQAGFDITLNSPTVTDVKCSCLNTTHFYLKFAVEGSIEDQSKNFVYNGSFPRYGDASALINGKITDDLLFPNCENLPPIVNITAPDTGLTFIQGDMITFIGNLSSDPDGDYPLNFSWTSSIDGQFSTANVTVQDTTSGWTLGSHTILLTVTDSRGAFGTDSITLTLNANNPPIAIITTPVDNGNFSSGENISFDGSTSDDLDNDPLTFQWTSSIDGVLSTSSIFSTTVLSDGSHTITLTVNDQRGLGNSIDTDTHTINIGSASFPEIGEARLIANVNTSWRTVTLNRTYYKPVVTCTYNIPGFTSNPAVVRVTNVQSTSFDVRLQNPGDLVSVTSDDVHCIIMEEGDWTLIDGRAVEAYRVLSDDTGYQGSGWGNSRMESVGYTRSYSNPVVLGQVMSYNNADWSVFWDSDGTSKNQPPQGEPNPHLYIGKHVGEDSDTSRSDERLGYIVVEQGSGTLSTTAYEAARGSDIVRGVTNIPPYIYNLGATYQVGVATQAAMDGGDGGWAVLYGTTPLAGNQIDLAVDEDQIRNSERAHTTENVAYWVFSKESMIYGTARTPVYNDSFTNDTTGNYTWRLHDTYTSGTGYSWNAGGYVSMDGTYSGGSCCWVPAKVEADRTFNLPTSGYARINFTLTGDGAGQSRMIFQLKQDDNNMYSFKVTDDTYGGSGYSQGVSKTVGGVDVNSYTGPGTIGVLNGESESGNTVYSLNEPIDMEIWWSPTRLRLEVNEENIINLETSDTTIIDPSSFVFRSYRFNANWDSIKIYD